MNSYKYTMPEILDMLGGTCTDEINKIFQNNGIDNIDVRDVNDLIVAKSLKYNFAEINLHVKTKEFCCGRKIQNNKLNVIDLFCGAGGSSSGFRLAGFNIIGALDINKAAIKTHKVNFKDCKTILGDITELKPEMFEEILKGEKVDVIIGSPPCQTFSSLSQGKIKSLGKDIKLDIRNYFYKNYLDYIQYFKPKAFLMENVPGFMTRYGGEIFNDFLGYLNEHLPEYRVIYKVLDAKNFSVPQSRKRLFVCGVLKKFAFEFPENNNFLLDNGAFVNVADAISDLPLICDNWRLDKMPYQNGPSNLYQKFMQNGEEMVSNNICRISNPQAKELFDLLKPGERYSDLSEFDKEKVSLFRNFNSKVIMGRCHRLPLDDISWTVIAHIGMDGYEYIHPTDCRTISVREAARLQSFTDDFVFVGNMREQYVQIGNAVPPLLSYAIANEIAKSLCSENK